MARKQPPPRPTTFHEPLWAAKALSAWPLGPPVIPASTSPDDAARILAEHVDCVKNPAWVVWGSNLFDHPDSLAITNDRDEPIRGAGPLCKITYCKGQDPKSTSPEFVAKRIAECVNALMGTVNPAAIQESIHALLAEIARDQSFDYGKRAVAILAMLGKPVSQGESS